MSRLEGGGSSVFAAATGEQTKQLTASLVPHDARRHAGGVQKQYQQTAGTALSERQAYRWVAGEVRSLLYPQAQATLERLFDEPVARLFGLPYGIDAVRPARCRDGVVPERGSARTDWQGQVITMSADRARDFLTRIEVSNVGAETLDQLIDDVRRLVTA
ncbi:MAG: hypothetical protein ACRDTA_28805 [Pseudonocardiaceae bacterium]